MEYDVIWSAPLVLTGDDTIAVGDVLVLKADRSGFVLATAANRTAASRRSAGVARLAADITTPRTDIQQTGMIEKELTGLGPGTSSYIRVSSAGRLERCTPSGADDVVGRCDTDGTAYLHFGTYTATLVTGSTALGATITDPDWYINPSTGSDSNTGLSSGQALASWAGLLAKWGTAPKLAPTGSVLTVHLLGNLVEALNPPSGAFIAKNADIIIKGETVATARTGTLSSVTALNRATSQATQAADTALTNWAADIGKRVKLTSGASSGAYAWVLKDLGSKTARLSAWATPPAVGGGAVICTLGAATNGNTYALQTLTTAYLSEVDMHGDFSDGSVPTISFVDIDFAGAFTLPAITGTAPVTFYGCRFAQQPVPMANTQVSFVNCCLREALFPQNGSFTALHAGCAFPGSFGLEINAFNSIISLDGDFVSQGCPVLATNGLLQWGTAGVYDVTAALAQNPNAAAVCLAGGSVEGNAALAMAVTNYGVTALYGSGSTGPGVDVGSGAKMVYPAGATLAITGTGGNFKLATATTGRAWNESTGFYTGSIACTWALLTTAIGSSGFGGSAHCLDGDAHILSATGTGGGPAPAAGFTPPAGTGPIKVSGGALVGAAAPINPTVATDFTVGGANTVLTSNGTVGVWATIVNANVAAGAAIAASKLAPPGLTTQVITNQGGAFAADANFTYDAAGSASLGTSIKLGAGTMPASGRVRIAYNGGSAVTVIGAKDSGAVDRSGVGYGAGDVWTFGNLSQDTTLYYITNFNILGASDAVLTYNGTTLTLGCNAGFSTFAPRIDIFASSWVDIGISGTDYLFLSAGFVQGGVPYIGEATAYGIHGEVLVAGPAGGTTTLGSSEYQNHIIQVGNAINGGTSGLGGNVDFPTPASTKGYTKFVYNGCNAAITCRKAGGGGATVSINAGSAAVIAVTPNGVVRT